ncbi:MAG: cellulase family glycosylhydrolase [Polyangiaceae bacterium]|nr:cellulase family glycosylhydrolase [Polyangiaceae bacterium]
MFEGFVVEGADATTPGTNSYAIYLRNSTSALTARHNVVRAGRGAPGQSWVAGSNGQNGVPGSPGAATRNTTCTIGQVVTSGGAGGVRVCAGGTSVNGGAGGAARCPDVDLQSGNGDRGLNAGGLGGLGGWGHRSSSTGSCQPTAGQVGVGFPGENGAAVPDGASGAGCGVTASRGSVVGGEWEGGSGESAANGQHGRGGGGSGGGQRSSPEATLEARPRLAWTLFQRYRCCWQPDWCSKPVPSLDQREGLTLSLAIFDDRLAAAAVRLGITCWQAGKGWRFFLIEWCVAAHLELPMPRHHRRLGARAPLWLGTILSLSLVIACTNDETVAREGSPEETATGIGRLRVEDGKLLDAEGDPVALEGLGLGEVSAVKQQGRWNEDYFAKARSWGAEMVRLPVNPGTFRDNAEQTLEDLDSAVEWCNSNDLYLVIDYHLDGNVPDQLFMYGDMCGGTWEDTREFWGTVAPRYADEPAVAFYEIYNEPTAMEWEGGSWEFADWTAQADDLVALVRSHAPHTIPLVSGLDFAYDFSDGGDTPFTSPDIALSVHPYPGRARTDRRTAWDSAFGYLCDRYPIVFTEVGFDPLDDEELAYQGDLEYGREIMGYAREKHISWAAFVFFRDPYWPMPLFSDWEGLSPTLSGQFFKDLLAGQAIEEAGAGYVPVTAPEDPPGNGPSGLHWGLWADPGASAEWRDSPSDTSAAVHIEAEPAVQAGMYANFAWDRAVLDVSGYNEVVLEATIAEGQPFSFSFGRNEGDEYHGCSYDLVGAGSSTYLVDLLEPNWCGPTTCFDMQAEGVAFYNAWSTSPTSVDIQVDGVEFRANPDHPLPEGGQVGTGACAD